MDDAVPTPAVVDAVVRVGDLETLQRVLRGPVDVGCTAGPHAVTDGGYELNLATTPAHLAVLRESGLQVREVVRSAGATPADVGSGDRYQGGRLVPRGVGQRVGFVRWLVSRLRAFFR